jgi:hypothetical protein
VLGLACSGASSPTLASLDRLPRGAMRTEPGPPPRLAQSRKAEQELDAIALQALLGPMLSGPQAGRLGPGPAGRHWQTMMIEQLARHLAESGQLRLARMPSPQIAPAPCPKTAIAGPGGWTTVVASAVRKEAPSAHGACTRVHERGPRR